MKHMLWIKLSFVFLFALQSVVPSLAAPGDKPEANLPQPEKGISKHLDIKGLPDTIVTDLNMSTVDGLISYMAIGRTNPQPMAPITSPAGITIYPSVDLIPFEIQQIRDFFSNGGQFADSTAPLANKGIIVLRYGADTPLILDLFSELKNKAVYSAVIVTDGPSTTDPKNVEFPLNSKGNPMDISALIKDSDLSEGKQGKIFRALLEAGYQLKSAAQPIEGDLIKPNDFFVTMSGAMPKGVSMAPIMHEKEIVMYEVIDPTKPLSLENVALVHVAHGTGNWTRSHYNRTFLLKDRPLETASTPNRAALQHALNVIEAFARPTSTGRISAIETIGRQRFQAQDGSHLEISYTDGKHDQNERIAAVLNNFADNPELVRLESITLSHFVFTNKNVRDALVRAWQVANKLGRPFRIKGILDEKFVGTRSFGLASTLIGFDVKTSFGKVVDAVPPELSKFVDLYVNFEEIPGAININRDGPPSHRVLTHDKTTVIEWTEISSGKTWSDSFVGSYNLSGNEANLERQDWWRLPKSSTFVSAILESIEIYRNEQIEKKMALPLREATLLLALAQFVGHSPVDLINWDNEIAKIPHNRDRMYDLNFVEVLRRMLKKYNGLVSLNQKITKEDLQPIFKELQSTVEKLMDKPSRLYRPDQVTPETLREKLNTLKSFMGWYLTLPRFQQGFKSNISVQEALELIFSLMEIPRTARSTFMKILYRPEIPLHILEMRAYEAYTNLNLQKILAKPADGDFPGQSGEFPFYKDVVVRPNMFPRELQTKIVSYFIAGKNAAIATEVQAILKDIPNLIDRKELISRLRQLHSVATWFLDLDPSIAPKPLSLSKEESFRRLIFDNLNMLMQPQIPAETFRQTLRFLLSVRGVDPKQMDALIDGPIAKRIKILVRLPTVPIGGEISGEALAAPALTKPANRTGAVTCEGSYGR